MVETLEVPVTDEEDAVADLLAYSVQQGWGDGLPLVPPTRKRVTEMVAAGGRRGDDVVAVLPPKNGAATVEQIAVNAVMAGCLPEYFPVVLAAIEALTDPRFELYGINTTTNPAVPMLIINGPIRQALNINCSWNVMGPGNRANATIGRAVSLVMINGAGRIPGQVCKGTQKQPGGYTFCVGEFEEKSPWEPLHVERGFRPEESTVTVIAPTGTTNCLYGGSDPDDLLMTVSSAFMCTGSTNFSPFYGLGEMGMGVMFCPDHAAVLGERYQKQDIKQFLLDHARIAAELVPQRTLEQSRSSGSGQVEGDHLRVAARADQFLLFVSGGLGGFHSVALPSFGDSYAITRRIETG